MTLSFASWLVTQTNRLSCAYPVYTDKCMPPDPPLADMIVHAQEVHYCSQDWIDDVKDAYNVYLAVKAGERG